MTTQTFKRPPDGTPPDDPGVLFLRSYLLIRTAVGTIGILLPVVLALTDWFFVAHGINAKGLPQVPSDTSGWGLLHLRGSISAYYHTAAGDLFVGGLAVVGALLVLYLAGQWDKWDCRLSLVAGVAVLGVVYFPTARPNQVIPADQLVPSDGCALTPPPSDCAPIQILLGETKTAGIHFTFALIFIGALAALAFVFSRRMSVNEPQNPYRHVQTVCGCLIIAAIIWLAIGTWARINIFSLTPLYVAEVVSVWAFATSWLLKGLSIRSLISRLGHAPGRPTA